MLCKTLQISHTILHKNKFYFIDREQTFWYNFYIDYLLCVRR